MILVLTIDDARVDDFKAAFLSVYPAPVDEETGEQTIADNPWIKKRIIEWLRMTYKQGSNKIYMSQKPVVTDTTFIK